MVHYHLAARLLNLYLPVTRLFHGCQTPTSPLEPFLNLYTGSNLWELMLRAAYSLKAKKHFCITMRYLEWRGICQLGKRMTLGVGLFSGVEWDRVKTITTACLSLQKLYPYVMEHSHTQRVTASNGKQFQKMRFPEISNPIHKGGHL